MMLLATIIGHVILIVARVIVLPFIIIGYFLGFAWGLGYYGWDKSMKHQSILVDSYEKRNKPGDR